MRKTLKFFHTLAAAGVIGSLLASSMIIYGFSPTLPFIEISAAVLYRLSQFLLLPSLATVLVTGLLSMAVHKPFQEMRWAWLKALLRLCMFEAALAVVASAGDAHKMATTAGSS